MTHGWLVPLLGATLVVAASGCGERSVPGGAAEAEGAAERDTGAPPAVRTAAVPTDPCAWIPSDQVAGLIGPLEGKPERIRSVDQPSPDEDGSACHYRLAAQPRLGGRGVSVEVSPSAGVLFERTGGAMQEHFAVALRDSGSAPRPRRAPDEGWDYSGHLPMGLVSYIGRAGHVSVFVVSQSPDVPQARLAALAARIRDRIPDLPFPLPPDPMLQELKRMQGGEPEPPPSGPDPCELLTLAEAEAVLGKLVVEPYRSSESTPLADPHGNGCAYFTAGHRALVLRPHREGGKMLFSMARSAGGMVAPVLPEVGPDRESADTLDGPWDEAAANGTTGELYFLKGDRMLEIAYLTSATDAAGAVRLARLAVERL